MRIPATVCACERRPAELRHERAALIWYSSECACPPRHARARAREHRRMRAISIRYPHARHFHRSPLVAGCVRSPRAAPPFPPPPHTQTRPSPPPRPCDPRAPPARSTARLLAPALRAQRRAGSCSARVHTHACAWCRRYRQCPAQCLCSGPLTACMIAIRSTIRSAIRCAVQ